MGSSTTLTSALAVPPRPSSTRSWNVSVVTVETCGPTKVGVTLWTLESVTARSAELRPGEGQGITVRISTRGAIELDRRPGVPCLIWTCICYRWVIHIGDMDIGRRLGAHLTITHRQLEAQRDTSRINQRGDEGRLGLRRISRVSPLDR